VLARNPNVKVSAKVASNHSKILHNDSAAVAQTVRESDPAARILPNLLICVVIFGLAFR
jgi:hypothetical protein